MACPSCPVPDPAGCDYPRGGHWCRRCGRGKRLPWREVLDREDVFANEAPEHDALGIIFGRPFGKLLLS